ncbi:LamG domain-containing protein [Membranihabitans maritimus]|uniref:LamG domain-containing protein n=1 Tax=Membranihabitans maritimus TaxID=2904244 RepID=UPI001F30B455|nr:LamG domain-containing protein [Membranihabitans maritimus]
MLTGRLINHFIITVILSLLCWYSPLQGQEITVNSNDKLIKKILSERNLVALWKFDEETGNPRRALGEENFILEEGNGPVKRINEGPISGKSIYLDGNKYLSLPNSQTGTLNLHGKDQEVTVVAWIKWTGEQTGFIGGMWNEYAEGGKRQYGLFVDLPYYNGADQVCGHISHTGKPTPPFPYSIDYSASKQTVPVDEWCTVAFTYDGEYITSYLNGKSLSREPELIEHTKGFPGYPEGLVQIKNPYYFPHGMGDNGSDFTVGAVLLKRGMGNFFKGLIGGLAIYRKALNERDLIKLVP